jgi:2',3'-cyclic-nucleotide 2'-phosphodiesterase (5'-nucleotidase family)
MLARLLIAPIFLLAAALPARAEIELVILHTSEHHGRLQPIEEGPFKGLGGVARRAALIERIRKEAKHVLLLDSGDLLVGTAMSSVFRGLPDVAAMSLMRYDGMAVGNHDFDFGVGHLRALRKSARFPFLCTNIRPKQDGACESFIVKSVGPLRVGLIGLIGKKSFPDLFVPSVVRQVKFDDPVSAAKTAAAEIRRRVDLLVAVTHQETEEDLALAGAVPEIDVIVGGHTAGFDGLILPTGQTPIQGRVDSLPAGPIFVKSHQQARALGRLDLVVDKRLRSAEARNLPVDQSLPEEPKVAALVQKYSRRLEAMSRLALGRALSLLEGTTDAVRTRESNFGDLLADLARSKAGPEIALVHSGLIRGSIPAGPVTIKQVMAALPYSNPQVSLKLTGKQLREALENSVSLLPQPSGRFLQVSGLTFLFDPSQPAGSRVKEILVHGAAVDLNRSYSVVVDQFIAEGGDGYAVLLQGRERRERQTPLNDLLAAALKKGSVGAKEEGRIKRVSSEQ